jgi:hypothetical protein
MKAPGEVDMTLLDSIGNRICMASSWLGVAYILYWHLMR